MVGTKAIVFPDLRRSEEKSRIWLTVRKIWMANSLFPVKTGMR